MHISAPINHINNHIIKIYNEYIYTIIIIKIFTFFSLHCIKMSTKNINFNTKKIKKS